MNDHEDFKWHIEKIYHHIEVLNREYGEICERTATLEAINKLNQKILWLILAGVLANAVSQIFF